MIPEFGQFLLILAFVLAVTLSIVPLIGVAQRDQRLMLLSRPLAYLQFTALAGAFLCLVYAFVNNDFTVKYVAMTSNSQLPAFYKVSAVWGGHEGSLLLWVWVLSGWTAAVAYFSRALPKEMVARVLAVMGMIAIGFLAFTIWTSNPFERLLPDFPPDGQDLNPLLQDIGLIIHPPMLYMGYVGFSVAFAFAVAGLLGGRLDSAWARWTRPWTTVAWCFLTIGIALGSWWAYYELGWGGWWFWDPVENASFMPWLAGTALMHSLAVTEKRGVFKAWTVLLALTAFSLSLLGTFLVRSGVLTSVHAFASDPERGMFILVFLLLVVGSSLLLFVLRANVFRSESTYTLLSREAMLMVNNALLMIATTVVLLGTLYPIATDIFDLGKISIGPPYYNGMFVPITLVLLFFIGLGPWVNWKRHDAQQIKKPLGLILSLSMVMGVILPLMFTGDITVSVVMAVGLVIWVLLASIWDAYKKMRTAKAGLYAGWRRLSRSYKGMLVAHLGLLVTVLGVALTSTYELGREAKVAMGDEITLGDYRFEFVETVTLSGPNYEAKRVIVNARHVDADESMAMRMTPEKRFYYSGGDEMTEAAIDAGFFRDVFVTLGQQLPDGTWPVGVYYKPFVRWLWLGSILMALGGFLAVSDPRYRELRRMKRQQATAACTGVAS